MLEAAIQVLLQTGKQNLTTTRVALRAGVSVGTLYQYFPNKSALLQAVLRRHLDEVAVAVEDVCRQQRGQKLEQMGTALITGFLAAKMRNPKTSVALYAVSSDLDGARIANEMHARLNKEMAALFASTCDPLHHEPHTMATMLQGAMIGVSRSLLESELSEERLAVLKAELIFFVQSYLCACSAKRPGGNHNGI